MHKNRPETARLEEPREFEMKLECLLKLVLLLQACADVGENDPAVEAADAMLQELEREEEA